MLSHSLTMDCTKHDRYFYKQTIVTPPPHHDVIMMVTAPSSWDSNHCSVVFDIATCAGYHTHVKITALRISLQD